MAPHGAAQPLLLILADETAGLGQLTLVIGPGNERNRLLWTEILHENFGVDAEFFDRFRLELLDPGHLARAGDLVAVGGVGEFTQLVLVNTHLLPEDMDGLVALGAPGLGPVTGLGGGSEGGRDSLVGVCRGDGDRFGDARLPLATLLPLTQPLARGEFVAGGALEGFGAALDGAGPLLLRA